MYGVFGGAVQPLLRAEGDATVHSCRLLHAVSAMNDGRHAVRPHPLLRPASARWPAHALEHARRRRVKGRRSGCVSGRQSRGARSIAPTFMSVDMVVIERWLIKVVTPSQK